MKILKQKINVQNVDIRGKPTIISLFSGCGGSSLGYQWAGFKELLAIDFDNNSVKTFELNFPNVPIWKKDIIKIESLDILKFCKIKKGELDILDASPPCQGFSKAAGKYLNVLDKRNDLFLEVIRIINELQPKVFLIENVTGLVEGIMKGKFKEIMLELKKTNYNVKCKAMNSKHYQVPQSRKRLIWIGVRKDLKIEPSFPKSERKYIRAKDVLKGLPKDIRKTLKNERLNCWIKTKFGENFSKYHPKKYYFNSTKINPEMPIPTITKVAGLYHWEYPRLLNISELKRLSTFPDDFQFIGNFLSQWARIGNAVMPKFMESIARHIKKEILKL